MSNTYKYGNTKLIYFIINYFIPIKVIEFKMTS